MINSTALPKVTLISAPIVSPRRLATHSVAWLNNPAKGMIATAFMPKMMAGFNPTASTAIPTGTKTSRTLTQLWHRAVLVWWTNRIEPFFMRTRGPGFGFSDSFSVLGPKFAVGAPVDGFTLACWAVEVAASSSGGGLLLGRLLGSCEEGKLWLKAWAFAHEWIRSRGDTVSPVAFIETRGTGRVLDSDGFVGSKSLPWAGWGSTTMETRDEGASKYQPRTEGANSRMYLGRGPGWRNQQAPA